MQERVNPTLSCNDRCIKDAVSIQTKKIFDSCRDQDCIEDLRVFLTESSQELVNRATSVKAGTAQLLSILLDVAPVGFKRGYYTVDARYFYRITAEAYVGGLRPSPVCGLAVFEKRAVLYGGDGGVKTFTSDDIASVRLDYPAPLATAEAVDPLVLNVKTMSSDCPYPLQTEMTDIPQAILDVFEEPLTTANDTCRLYVSLGQFTIIRVERDTQIVVPIYSYSVPEKTSEAFSGEFLPEDPCTVFRQISFPVEEFFPENEIQDGCCC